MGLFDGVMLGLVSFMASAAFTWAVWDWRTKTQDLNDRADRERTSVGLPPDGSACDVGWLDEEVSDEVAPGIVHIAGCPEHGLHGCRSTCFECGKPVEQGPMVEVAHSSTEARETIWQEGYDAAEDCQDEDLTLLRVAVERYLRGHGTAEEMRQVLNEQLPEQERVSAAHSSTEALLRDAERLLGEAADELEEVMGDSLTLALIREFLPVSATRTEGDL